jgi:hypothetical protein
MRLRARNQIFFILTTTLVGFVSLLYVTRAGICIITDSAYYMMAAEALSKYHAFGTFTPDGQIKPLTVWPPLYPALLSLFGLLGTGPAIAARWVHAVLFGLNASLAGLLARKISGGGFFVAAAAAVFFLSSTAMLGIHWVALSEPLFIFFLLICLSALCVYLARPLMWCLATAALAAGLTWLTRYSGVGFVAAGTLAVLLMSRLNLKRRIFHASLFALVASAPNLLWMARNMAAAGDMAGKRLGWHPATLSLMQEYATTLLRFMLPEGFIAATVAALALLGLSLLFALGWRRGHFTLALNRQQALLLLFVACYVALVYLSVSFLDANLVIDTWRLSLPIYVIGLLFAVSIAHRLLRVEDSRSPGKGFRRATLICAQVFVGAFVFRGAEWVVTSNSGEPKDIENANLTSGYWTESALVRAVKELPREAPIYTNGPEALYVLLGKPVDALPQKFSATTLAANVDYEQRLQEVNRKLGREGAVVYLYTHRFENLPTEKELREKLSLVEVFADKTGKLFKKIR